MESDAREVVILDMSKIMITMSLSSYLKSISKGWGEIFLTKTKGGQLWISSDAPGDIEGEGAYYKSLITGKKEYIGKNEIDFSYSDIFMRIPKEIAKHIEMDPGAFKKLEDVLKDIKAKEACE